MKQRKINHVEKTKTEKEKTEKDAKLVNPGLKNEILKK